MTFWQGLSALVVAGLLVFAVHAQIKRLKLPVRFRSLAELGAVRDVVWWARKHVPTTDPRWKHINQLWASVPFRCDFTTMGLRMSAQEVALIAPFIDQFIAGNGPPPLLSVEYEDERPALLSGFRARMQAEGLWPRDTTPEKPA